MNDARTSEVTREEAAPLISSRTKPPSVVVGIDRTAIRGELAGVGPDVFDVETQAYRGD